jgi:hypothetical protein
MLGLQNLRYLRGTVNGSSAMFRARLMAMVNRR